MSAGVASKMERPLSRSAIRDVVVNGRFILRDQRHDLQDEIVSRYQEVYREVWQNGRPGGRV